LRQTGQQKVAGLWLAIGTGAFTVGGSSVGGASSTDDRRDIGANNKNSRP